MNRCEAVTYLRDLISDSQEVADLYRRYGPAVHRRVLSMLRDPEEALDLTQETFLAYLKARPTLRNEASPFTLLYQIATCQAVDRLRRRSRWTGRLGPLSVAEEEERALEAEALTSHPGGVGQVEAAQDLALLTHREDPQVVTAAYLYFVEGHTTGEVAQVLELSRKTVGKLLAQFSERARKRSARLDPGAQEAS